MHARRVTVLLAAGLLAGLFQEVGGATAAFACGGPTDPCPPAGGGVVVLPGGGGSGVTIGVGTGAGGGVGTVRLGGSGSGGSGSGGSRRCSDSAGEWWCEYQPVLARSGLA